MSSDPLIEALLHAHAYPHETETPRLTETHISWVLLTGRYAYKIKKPLKLPFLDFSTLGERRRFCEEELRLNRRLAPELYLDVVPIGGSREAPRLGTEPAIEYAVKMKQFPADALLDRRLRQADVTVGAINALAELIARFHTELPAESGAGGEAATRAVRTAMDNFEPLEECLRDDESQRALVRIRAWTQAECRRLGATFARRAAAGRVREGHGDLHLENLVEIDGRIVPFDALEFDRSLRLVDVMSEAAFPMMDFMAHGRADLGFTFQNRYLEVTGDYDGLEVLRFYLVYRALVRAKVRVIKGSQETTLDTAAHGPLPYLGLAAKLIEPETPVLAITHGLSGSGKTTLTSALIGHLPGLRLRSDLERKRLHGLDAAEQSGSALGGGLYDSAATGRTYGALERHAAHIVRAGFHAIIDAAFLSWDRRRQFGRLARELGVRFKILEFRAPDNVLRERVRARERAGSDASEAGETVLAYQLEHHQPLTADERAEALVIDTEAAFDPAAVAHALLSGNE